MVVSEFGPPSRMRHRLLPVAASALAGLGVVAATAASRPSEAGAVRPALVVALPPEIAVVEGRTRLTLPLSGEVAASGFVLDRPDRAVIELPQVNCQVPAEAGRRRSPLVAGLRCGLFAIGRTRLVVDLSAPATISRLQVGDGPVPGTRQLVVELQPTDRDGFRRAMRRRDEGPETTGSIGGPARDPAALPLVAIDAGHGGLDPGATAATGDLEKDIVLAYARALRDRLAASGAVRVMMIRDGDVFVPLDERVRLAREASADLFVSVHGDSMSSPLVRGATVYTGAERATDADAARLAERENAADAAGGIVSPEAKAGVSDILHDLTVRETRGLSHRFAGILQRDLGPVMRFSPQPHREAGFRVLKSADMTSVLVELGYLSNPQDAGLLLSDDWRGRSTAAMAGAVERFFATRLAGRAAVSP